MGESLPPDSLSLDVGQLPVVAPLFAHNNPIIPPRSRNPGNGLPKQQESDMLTGKRRKDENIRRAFTLIELLIVVAIIGILAAIAVPNFMQARLRSKIALTVSNMRTIGLAMESYFLDNNTYTLWAWDGNDYGGFRSLTTPIAYITSGDIFKNPFKPHHDTRDKLPDGTELDPMYELGTFSAQTNAENYNFYPSNTWLLESCGPDLRDSYNARDFPFPPPAIYQISNGLLSLGGFIRGGGTMLPPWVRNITY